MEKSILPCRQKGPVEDYLQFEGTGLLEIREKGLGRINLLGNISKELADFLSDSDRSVNFRQNQFSLSPRARIHFFRQDENLGSAIRCGNYRKF